MIARLTVGVPFTVAVPDGARFTAYSYEEDGYTIVARAPGRSDQPFKGDMPSDIEIDGAKGFAANAIQFDFHKTAFDRTRAKGYFDPPIELMQRVVASFVARLRYVTRASQVHQFDLAGGATWRLQYLNDDESELPENPELSRAVGAVAFSVSLASLSPVVWESMYEFDSDWRPPVWDDILLDAFSALPSLGTALVLGATALEVFIADILERLASTGDIPSDIWTWINNRDDWHNDPSTEEQFDVLLKHFTGHSLKEETRLWQSFKELRTARNKFVHEGTPRIGGTVITEVKARQLLASANDTISTIRDWLPAEKKWAQPKLDVKLTVTLPLIPRTAT